MTKLKVNQLLIGDTLYDLTEAYRNGARACRAETPFWANPHRDGSQRHADWAYGHDNEAAGHHRVKVTLDVIEAKPAGLEFIAPQEKGLSPDQVHAPYRAFTTAYDEVVRAADLLLEIVDRRAAFRELRERFGPDQEGAWTGPERETMARALENLSSWNPEGGSRPVLFLLDNSGSMRGRQIAALVGVMDRIGAVFEERDAPFEILGFTTKTWKGGRSREQWIAEGRPAEPGRLCDLRHVIYKRADEPWDPETLTMMLTEGFLKENVDGEALLWAAERGRALGGAAIIHVTDGTPMDDSTLSVNRSDYLQRHLDQARCEINTDPDLQLLTIPVTHDLGRVAELLTRGVLSLTERSPVYKDDEAPAGP